MLHSREVRPPSRHSGVVVLVLLLTGAAWPQSLPIQVASTPAADGPAPRRISAIDTGVPDELFGNGADGPLVVEELSFLINRFSSVQDSSFGPGTATLTVDTNGSLSVGDEVLVHQSQHPFLAGQYEFAEVIALGPRTVTLSPLSLAYESGTFDVPNARAAQLIRVPHYTRLTVAADASIASLAWSDNKRGIVVARVQDTAIIRGQVSTESQGFRGGGVSVDQGIQGESTAGPGVSAENPNAGGGGGAVSLVNCDGVGGGGAGHALPGFPGEPHNGGEGGFGGVAYGSGDLTQELNLGSGGGSGARDKEGDAGGTAGAGGRGGGIILLFAKRLRLEGSIVSDGQDGGDATGDLAENGGGGAGSGGNILIITDRLAGPEHVSAEGGRGGLPSGDVRELRACGGDGSGGSTVLLGPASPAVGED